jgi:hypothetical protein
MTTLTMKPDRVPSTIRGETFREAASIIRGALQMGYSAADLPQLLDGQFAANGILERAADATGEKERE